MTDYRENIEIDLKKLFWYILRHWKVILLGMIIGLILGLCYRPVAMELAPRSNESQTLDDFRGKLTEKEASETEMLYNAYIEYQKLYSDLAGSEADYDDRFELVESAYQLFTAQNALSANAKSYYNDLMERDMGVVADDSSSRHENEAVQGRNIKQSLRNAPIGALLGLLIVVVIYALMYILTPTIKTADDIRLVFRLPVIGTVLETAQSTSLISAAILGAAKKEQTERVFAISSIEDRVSYKNLSEKIIRSLENITNISVFTGNNIFTDITAAESIKSSDAVVLIEQIGVTRYEDVAREVELCYNYGIKLLGVVIIE